MDAAKAPACDLYRRGIFAGMKQYNPDEAQHSIELDQVRPAQEHGDLID
jgi:hypothetical protein